AVTSTQSLAWDDFFPGQTASQEIGTLGWWTVGGDVTQSASVADHPGVVTLTAGDTADSTHYMHLGGDSGANGSFVGLDTATDWEVIFVFKTVESIAETKFTVGLVDDAAGDPADAGLWVRYWNSTGCTSNGTDTQWVFENCSAGGCSTQSGPPVEPDSWYTLRIRNDGEAGTIKYAMRTEGGPWSTEVQVSTNAPDTALLPMLKVMQCGSQTRGLQVDAYGHTLRSLSR
ncbi:hypothetical protein JXD38_03345, partial [candidate division WOR-3 bacterium]|nr:hypothetical protein [candidate division WOR-3 bacterium]